MFCQECGQRLAPRVAPPTTPVAPPAPGPSPAPLGNTSPLAVGVVSRALAPAPAPVPTQPRPPPPEPPRGAATRCPGCGAPNDRSLRFCVRCGTRIEASTEPLVTAASELAQRSAPPSIEARPVVTLPVPARVCARCQGANDASARFCKSCGASLGDSPAYAEPPRPPVVAALDLRASEALAWRPRIVTIARDGGEGASFPLKDVTDLGRSEGDIMVADDQFISPRHARLTRRGERVVLRDLESTNGVFVRIPVPAGPHAACSEVPLADQDLFLIGQQVLKLELVKGAEEGLGAASQHGTLIFGTPTAPRYARLAQRTVEGITRDIFYVRKLETILGREVGDIVFTDDPFLSRRHASIRIDRESRRPFLADLGSSNGTFLKIRDEVQLKHGDHFRIGQQLFRLDLEPPTRPETS